MAPTEPKTFVEVQARQHDRNEASQRILATLKFNDIEIYFHYPLWAIMSSFTHCEKITFDAM